MKNTSLIIRESHFPVMKLKELKHRVGVDMGFPENKPAEGQGKPNGGNRHFMDWR